MKKYINPVVFLKIENGAKKRAFVHAKIIPDN